MISESNATGHGLSQQQLTVIFKVLTPFKEAFDQVKIFGSRATGTYRPNSDLDLVFYGDISEACIDKLRTLFEESLLSIEVDLVAYQNIESELLIKHIRQHAVELVLP